MPYIERYRRRVVDVAQALGRSPDRMTKTLARAIQHRNEYPDFLEAAERLDHALAEAGAAAK